MRDLHWPVVLNIILKALHKFKPERKFEYLISIISKPKDAMFLKLKFCRLFVPDKQPYAISVLGMVLLASSVWPQSAISGDNPTLIIATTIAANERFRYSDGGLPIDKPGWHAELLSRAATECGSEVKYKFVPWARALKMVESGEIQAAFNSSYKSERAEYGVYPFKDGKPDETRASKYLAYHAYVKKGSDNNTLAENDNIEGHKVAVERDASIIPELKNRGAIIYEVANEDNMLRMVANERVDAAILISDHIEGLFSAYPEFQLSIDELQPPIQTRVSYVMFSKVFYADHQELVECFWTTHAKLKDTDWFRKMRATYD